MSGQPAQQKNSGSRIIRMRIDVLLHRSIHEHVARMRAEFDPDWTTQQSIKKLLRAGVASWRRAENKQAGLTETAAS